MDLLKYEVLYVGNKFWAEYVKKQHKFIHPKYAPTDRHEFLKIVNGRANNMLFIPLSYDDIKDLTEEKLDSIIKDFLRYND